MTSLRPWLNRIYSTKTAGPDVLRLVVGAITFTHGFHRFATHEVTGLARVLVEQGMPASLVLAFLVTLGETLGPVLLAVRLLVWPVTLVLSGIYFAGIMMFNRHNGFFLVGAGEGGWEYNALLITCLLVTAWENRRHRLF